MDGLHVLFLWKGEPHEATDKTDTSVYPLPGPGPPCRDDSPGIRGREHGRRRGRHGQRHRDGCMAQPGRGAHHRRHRGRQPRLHAVRPEQLRHIRGHPAFRESGQAPVQRRRSPVPGFPPLFLLQAGHSAAAHHQRRAQRHPRGHGGHPAVLLLRICRAARGRQGRHPFRGAGVRHLQAGHRAYRLFHPRRAQLRHDRHGSGPLQPDVRWGAPQDDAQPDPPEPAWRRRT